jgi:hypothetical protein
LVHISSSWVEIILYTEFQLSNSLCVEVICTCTDCDRTAPGCGYLDGIFRLFYDVKYREYRRNSDLGIYFISLYWIDFVPKKLENLHINHCLTLQLKCEDHPVVGRLVSIASFRS